MDDEDDDDYGDALELRLPAMLLWTAKYWRWQPSGARQLTN